MIAPWRDVGSTPNTVAQQKGADNNQYDLTE